MHGSSHGSLSVEALALAPVQLRRYSRELQGSPRKEEPVNGRHAPVILKLLHQEASVQLLLAVTTSRMPCSLWILDFGCSGIPLEVGKGPTTALVARNFQPPGCCPSGRQLSSMRSLAMLAAGFFRDLNTHPQASKNPQITMSLIIM